MPDFNPADLVTFFICFLFALCFHEWAHGMVAKLRGDRTAEMMGRLTLTLWPMLICLAPSYFRL